MATKLWLGNDPGNEGNWGVAANWSPAGVPVNADDIIFDGTSDQSVTAGLDQSAVNPGTMRVCYDYTGSIGASGSPLKFNYITNYLTYSGQGTEAWFEFVHVGTVTPVHVLDSNSGTNALHLKSAAGGLQLTLYKGKITVDSGSTIKNPLFIHYISTSASDVNLTIATGALFAANLFVYQFGGTVTSAVGSGSVDIETFTGTWTTTGTAAIYRYKLHGGLVKHNSTGNVTFGYVDGGTLDFSDSPGCSITSTTYVADDATINLRNGLRNVLAATGIEMRGGTVLVDHGRRLTPS